MAIPAFVRLVSERVDVATREPVEAQLDGDAVGAAPADDLHGCGRSP